MSYANTHRKTVLVLNAEFGAPQLFNASSHALLGLAGKAVMSDFHLLPYPSPSFGVDSAISEFPVVVLRAKRSSQLEKLVGQLAGAGVMHNVFLDAMIGATADQQQQATLQAQPGAARLMCVALFGDEEVIRPIIKSFSVYKASNAPAANGVDAVPQP